jgi:hypothetical protein
MTVYKTLAMSIAKSRPCTVARLGQFQLEETTPSFCIPAYVKYILRTPEITWVIHFFGQKSTLLISSSISNVCEALGYKKSAGPRIEELYSEYDDCVNRMMQQQWEPSRLSKDLPQTLSFPQRTSNLEATAAALAQTNSLPDQHHGLNCIQPPLQRDPPNGDGVFMGGDGKDKDQLTSLNLFLKGQLTFTAPATN